MLPSCFASTYIVRPKKACSLPKYVFPNSPQRTDIFNLQCFAPFPLIPFSDFLPPRREGIWNVQYQKMQCHYLFLEIRSQSWISGLSTEASEQVRSPALGADRIGSLNLAAPRKHARSARIPIKSWVGAKALSCSFVKVRHRGIQETLGTKKY